MVSKQWEQLSLIEVVTMFEECGYRRMSCEAECPLNRPVHKHSEQPTICATLTDLSNNLPTVEAP